MTIDTHVSRRFDVTREMADEEIAAWEQVQRARLVCDRSWRVYEEAYAAWRALRKRNQGGPLTFAKQRSS